MELNSFVKNTGKLLLVSALIITACKKKDDKKDETPTPAEEAQPSASFAAGKSDYIAGDTILLTSTSTNAGSLRWTLPNGTTETTQSIRFSTNSYTNSPIEVELPFRLDAISPSGKKTDYSVKNIKIGRLITGGVLISMYRSTYADITGTLIMDGNSLGTITINAGPSIPSGCGSAGFITLHPKVGTHRFTFNYTENGNSATGTQTVTVTDGGCAYLHF